MKKESTFQEAHIRGTSFRSRGRQRLLSGEYDVAVLTSSWDSRCVCVTESQHLRADAGVLILFDQRDSGGLRDKHDPLLWQFCQSHAQKPEKLLGSSSDLCGVFNKLVDVVTRTCVDRGRPLRIFMDLSGCPRYYAIGLLAAFLGNGMCERFTMFYSEGVYGVGRGEEEIAFTGGRWRSVAIPGLSGLCDPAKENFYLVSVGFEGSKTQRSVSRADPDRVAVLFPKPGVQEGYVQKARELNRELLKRYRVSRAQIVEAHAADAIGAWRALAENSLDRPAKENSYYVCCGTKPHSLGMALRAMATEHPAVLYNVPDEYRVVEVKPTGVFWRFDVVDLSAV